jgi:diguanylate cyclase (GGDEF)-like protein
MHSNFIAQNRFLTGLSHWQILSISFCGIAVIGTIDYLTGYQVSVSVFYLMPVAIASWYAGRREGLFIAALACSSWFAADIVAEHPYENLAIPIWNAIVRLAFFIVNALLLVALRDSLLRQYDLARTDALTGAFGRRAFEERLEHDLDLARRKGSPLTVAIVDLDDFKAINDTRGHIAGDQALCLTVRVLQESTRCTDTVARLGGDEFALVFPDTARLGAEEVTTKIMHNLREAFKLMAPELTCSIGVITFDDIPLKLNEAVRSADDLMYQAKREGKNRVTFRVVTEGTCQVAQH